MSKANSTSKKKTFRIKRFSWSVRVTPRKEPRGKRPGGCDSCGCSK